jgi:hypothetical protein
MDNFISDIIQSFENLNKIKNGINGEGEWTVAIKKTLIDIAEKYNLSVNCSGIGDQYKHNQHKEWLYDIIIYSWENDVFDDVYLVGESEWKNWRSWETYYEEIEEDFLKLIFARSKVRLIVFEADNENYPIYREGLINTIEKSNSCIEGDLYIFAIWHTEYDGFKVEKYIKEKK